MTDQSSPRTDLVDWLTELLDSTSIYELLMEPRKAASRIVDGFLIRSEAQSLSTGASRGTRCPATHEVAGWCSRDEGHPGAHESRNMRGPGLGAWWNDRYPRESEAQSLLGEREGIDWLLVFRAFREASGMGIGAELQDQIREAYARLASLPTEGGER